MFAYRQSAPPEDLQWTLSAARYLLSAERRKRMGGYEPANHRISVGTVSLGLIL
jgi:hypothetical protein